ncbi:unnamed protein product [Bursaphelenchus okinawaensis]|uniref:Uncharacterized protein n=1 Tax=Bursaphelenchus okinawaensis TaxID=465554 RepID=A0A811L858_9BILA|nr:unnamed protein product [Bursaphelenchus okinawaensis]CAG9117545.1 unnamed protein product [Bursaphelenchus okinawaensis]
MASSKFNVYKASLAWNRNDASDSLMDDSTVVIIISGLIILSILLCFCYTEDKLKSWKMAKRKLTEEQAIISVPEIEEQPVFIVPQEQIIGNDLEIV